MSRYRLYVASDRSDHVVAGRSPAKALRELVEAAGLELASQDGRYGRLVDGTTVAAMTEAWSRRRVDPLERTTRL
jgi:hypothetical protein